MVCDDRCRVEPMRARPTPPRGRRGDRALRAAFVCPRRRPCSRARWSRWPARGTPARAKALLFAAGRLAVFAESVGLELERAWCCCQSAVIERFVLVGCAGVSPATRRTLRTNLRALARALERYPQPAPVPLVRERAKRPYSLAEIDGFLRLADAQSHAGAAAARERAGVPRRRRGDHHGRAAARPRQRRRCALRRGDRAARRRALALGAGPRALPRAAVGGGRVRRRSVRDRRAQSGPAQRHRHALRRAVDRQLAAQAAGRPAALHVAGASAPGRSGWARSCRPPGSPAASGSGTSPRSSPQRPRTSWSRCSEARPVSDDLERIEEIIDAAGVADIEPLLPIGVRPRQLKVTTLLIGMTLAAARRPPRVPADVHTTLTALPEDVQRRLGVIARWKHGEHRLTYRQVEYTFDRLTSALAKDTAGRHPVRAAPRRPGPAARSVASRCSASPPPAATRSTGPTRKPGRCHHPRNPPPPAPPTPAAADGDTTPEDHDASQATEQHHHSAARATPAAAPTPRRPGDTAAATTPARKTSCSTATTSKPSPPSTTNTAHRSPNSPAACT